MLNLNSFRIWGTFNLLFQLAEEERAAQPAIFITDVTAPLGLVDRMFEP